MSKFGYSKMLMEKFLRRSFYDAVILLYENTQRTRIISISLEGNLTLVVNKDEKFVIKLNEVSQRADDRDEHQQKVKTVHDVKLEGSANRRLTKKEFHSSTSAHAGPIVSSIPTEMDKFMLDASVDGGRGVINDQKYKFVEETEVKLNDSKIDSDKSEKSSEGETESDEDIEMAVQFHQSTLHSGGSQPAVSNKAEVCIPHADSICFLPVGQVNESKRRCEYSEQNEVEFDRKKSEASKRMRTFPSEMSGEMYKVDDRDKAGTSSAGDDCSTGIPQLLPHTATGPVIIEDDDGSYSSNMTESQMAQIAMLQTRDSGLGMLRQQDLEELARQQQWQMAAYQRSIIEKSGHQPHMHQYQRDADRFRWEYSPQQQRDVVQPRDYIRPADEVEKMYRQVQCQNATPDAALLTASGFEQAKRSSREGSDIVGTITDKLSPQQMRLLVEEHMASQLNAEFDGGEFRQESHSCALCGLKYASLELLILHMEEHRVDFERSCSVCQSGTLTGNMLILHMEASHGPEINFPLPASSTSVSSVITDFSQPFPTSLQVDYSIQLPEEPADTQLPQQPHTPEHAVNVVAEAASSSDVKSESGESFDRTFATSTSKDDSDFETLHHNNFLGIPSQFLPLIACQVCGEKFALSESLDEHVESQHKDACCTYTCKPCCFLCSTHTEYSKHMMLHEASSSNMKCNHCLKSFKSGKQLRLHYVAAHACCHFCEYCRAGFPDAESLKLHENMHTMDPDKLTFRCDICSKAFFTQSQCSAHKRTHKEEKAHTCDVCGSAFFKRGDLTKHVRTVHSPSRLFTCKFCGKKGTRMDNMRSHVKSHHKHMTRNEISDMITIIE